MALTSFTLRKSSSGSYLQKTGNFDNSLRSDGVSSAAVIEGLTTGENTFSANILERGTVRLEWTLEEPLVSTVTSGVKPVELRIISSYSGEPVTVRDGNLIKTITSSSLDYFHDDMPNVPEGRWVYYSLFAKFSDGTDFWFIRVATLYIQIPISYNSVESLWSKIPEYYRALDYQQELLSSGYYPLYAFLELFGNEVDRTRTLIDSVALSNDPSLAVTPALEQLANETGLEINISDLGTSKVRALLNNIGTLRQQKGTVSSVCSYISAMSGCLVEYYKSTNHIFRVHAQRVNFISDPQFDNQTITTTTDTCNNGTTNYDVSWSRTTTWGVYNYGANSMGASSPTITDVGSGIQYTLPPGSYSNRTVFVYPRRSFPYLGSVTYGTSYDYSGTSGASFDSFHVINNSTRLSWEGGVGAASMPAVLFTDTWNTGTKIAFTSTTQRPSYEYSASSISASATVASVPVLVFQMAPGSSITISKWLFEPAVNGDYFDGNTREGGYIPIQSGVSGQGTFDYYWDTSQGGANNAYSYYLMDHEKTIKVTESVISQYIMPVNMLSSYTIIWDYYPGKP